MNVIALNESMSLSDSHDGAFVNSDYLTDALGVERLLGVTSDCGLVVLLMLFLKSSEYVL
jgi:hypothetical protein